ncbi:hypothetical protein GCM10023184_00270 [Flaviaesturariibacter amylovorans]|uniref:Uncharacterized protein n=2 Tax=Flaviaesturariibacter amylovorans TaxID=1084520 RepID=A0ABP8G3Z1_9BACT
MGVSNGEAGPVTFDMGFLRMTFSLGSEGDTYDYSLNFVAMGFLIWINRLMKTVKEEAGHHAISELGQ